MNYCHLPPAELVGIYFPPSKTDVAAAAKVQHHLREQKISVYGLRQVFWSMDKLGVTRISELCQMRLNGASIDEVSQEIAKERIDSSADISWLNNFDDDAVETVDAMVKALVAKANEIAADIRKGVWEYTDVPIMHLNDLYPGMSGSRELVTRGASLFLTGFECRSEDQGMLHFRDSSFDLDNRPSKWKEFVQSAVKNLNVSTPCSHIASDRSSLKTSR